MLKTEKTEKAQKAGTPARRLTSLRLCALFSAVALAACGGGKEEAAPAPPTAAPTPAPPAPVVTAPSISTQPAATTVASGASASFSVLASGTAPFTYQWQRNGTAISGATGASYSFNATEADSGAEFRVVVSNSAGSVTSSAAALTVLPVVLAPSIAVAPQSVSTLDGGTATFVVVAEGTGPFTYAWQRNGSAITGASTASYTTPDLTLADSGARYRVVVSNSAGSITSGEATLTVNPVAPAIATAPASVAVTAGQTATFSATATGSAPLAYQWQRNGTAIAGATAASYTTPATTVADNGARFRVVVTNAGGSVTSAEATLGVSEAVVAPAIASAPVGATVTEGQTATFTAGATGTAPLAYQWLRNGTAISGATAASYTTAATTVTGDNNARFSVRVSNAAGSVTSAEVVLTVNAAANPLIGRAWVPGQLLETDDNEPSFARTAIDDAGRVTVVFRKSNGTRQVVYATRGVANAAGTAPSFSAPVPIDLLGGTVVSSMGTTTSNIEVGLAASPGGNLLAYWYNNAPCTATTYRTSGTCRYYYAARYLIANNAWEAPVLVGDTPEGDFNIRINDRGDVALLGTGWTRSGTSNFTEGTAAYFRAGTEATFRRQMLNVDPLRNHQLDMDGAGNVLLAAEASQNATRDLVVYRGTVAAGLGAQQVLDTRGNAVSLQLTRVGTGGQQVVVWAQNNGVTDTNYAATAASASEAFTVVDLGYRLNTSIGFRRLEVSDAGQAILFDFSARTRQRWTAASGWAARENLPSALPNNPSFFALASTRSGDILAVNYGVVSGGDWATYDAGRNVMVQTLTTASSGPGYVVGVNQGNAIGYTGLVVSASGIGFVALRNQFDVLPTAAAPSGDGRSVINLWGVFFK